ncbi:hypothetical protein [Fodinicola feengrottensis]|uniref:hypothetical protein n=1 Tax=Fodinicola feengrottensis TaxID=435914 RepID=UPI0013CFF99D|nr:hypothetical protein [Fodinicola feengrottensis]
MTVANVLIGLAVLAYLVFRQLQARPVKQKSNQIFLLVVAVYGLYSSAQVLQGHPLSPGGLGLVLVGLVLAGAFGLARALTVKLWRDGDQLMRQGTWLTASLWVIGVAVHLGLDVLAEKLGAPAGLGFASLPLYLAITWFVQRVVVNNRVRTA